MDTYAETGNTEAPRLYDIRAIELATFLSSCFAGAYLLARNFNVLGEPAKARNAIILGFLGTVGLAFLAFSIVVAPRAEAAVAFAIQTAQVAVLHVIAIRVNGQAIEKHREAGGKFFSRWRSAGISILVLPVVAIVFVVIGVVFPDLPALADAATDVPTRSATVADIPAILAKLATLRDGAFAVLMFDSPLSRGGDAVNLQYSVEHGTVGLDWVLLSQTNIADKGKVAAFAAELGHPMSERVMNNVCYLRTEGAGLDRLGTSIIVEFYGIPRNAQLGLITEGFQWPPKP